MPTEGNIATRVHLLIKLQAALFAKNELQKIRVNPPKSVVHHITDYNFRYTAEANWTILA